MLGAQGIVALKQPFVAVVDIDVTSPNIACWKAPGVILERGTFAMPTFTVEKLLKQRQTFLLYHYHIKLEISHVLWSLDDFEIILNILQIEAVVFQTKPCNSPRSLE